MTVSLQVWKISQKFEPTREVPQFQPPFWEVKDLRIIAMQGITKMRIMVGYVWWGFLSLPYESLYNLHRWPKHHRYSPENKNQIISFWQSFIVWPFRICWYKTGLCSPSKWCRGHNVSTLKGFRLEIFTKFYFVSLKFQHWIIAILEARCEKITSLIRWWVAFKDTGAPVNPERLGEQKGAAKWTLRMEKIDMIANYSLKAVAKKTKSFEQHTI